MNNKKILAFFALFLFFIFSCRDSINNQLLTNRIDFLNEKIFVTYKNNIFFINGEKIYKKEFYINDYVIFNNKLFLIQNSNVFTPEIQNNEIILNKLYDANSVYFYKDKIFLLKDKSIIIIENNIKKQNINLNKKYESLKVIMDTFILKDGNNIQIKKLINKKTKDIREIKYVKKFECYDYNLIYIDYENKIKQYDITTNKEELLDTVPFIINNFKIFGNILLIYGENVLELLYLDSKKIEIGRVELLDASLNLETTTIGILKHNKISTLNLIDKKVIKEIDLLEN